MPRISFTPYRPYHDNTNPEGIWYPFHPYPTENEDIINDPENQQTDLLTSAADVPVTSVFLNETQNYSIFFYSDFIHPNLLF